MAGSNIAMIDRIESEGLSCLRKGDLSGAQRRFSKASSLRERFPGLVYEGGGAIPFPIGSLKKLGHDLNQLEYLLRVGKLNRALGPRLRAGRRALSSISRSAEEDRFFLTPERREQLSRFSGLLRVTGDLENSGATLLRRRDDVGKVERQFRSTGLATLDDFLIPRALERLRRYCLESDIWHDPKPWAMGAQMNDGFCGRLLFQLVRESRRLFPGILGEIPFARMWAYLHDNQKGEVIPHADMGQVSINLWLTPDSSNLRPRTGGLAFYKTKAPLAWKNSDYLSGAESIGRKLRGATSEKIGYRCNRAVIFESRRFHGAQEIRFNPEFESRRLSVTLVFGEPCRGR